MNPDEHRRLRETLGAFALGQLTEAEETAVRWHLDGCPPCRVELSAIAPLANPLKLVDPARLGDDVPRPPADLDDAILNRIRAERSGQSFPVRRWAGLLAAAALVAVVAGGVGYRVAPRPPALPLESVAVQSSPGISSSANVVPHKWGMEIKLTAQGFAPGKKYVVMVTDSGGVQRSAGEFIGTGSNEMRCNLNSSVLRANAAGFQVLDPDHQIVLSSRF